MPVCIYISYRRWVGISNHLMMGWRVKPPSNANLLLPIIYCQVTTAPWPLNSRPSIPVTTVPSTTSPEPRLLLPANCVLWATIVPTRLWLCRRVFVRPAGTADWALGLHSPLFLLVIWSYSHNVILSFCHIVMITFYHFVIYSYSHDLIWIFWSFGHLVILFLLESYGNLVI